MGIKSGNESPAQVSRLFSPPAPPEYVVELADFRGSVGAAAVSNALKTFDRQPTTQLKQLDTTCALFTRSLIQEIYTKLREGGLLLKKRGT
jgi:hypothetical protein